MTPKEELFAKFFNNHGPVVEAMDDLTLRAHREELEKLVLEGKACLFRSDEEIKKRGTKKRGGGLNVSVQTDDVTSDAINTINERAKKLSKSEKAIEGLLKLGIDRATAEAMLSSRVIKDLKETGKADVDLYRKQSETPAIELSKETQKIINPFTKKEIVEQTTVPTPSVPLANKEAKEPEIKPKFNNPFAKRGE